MDRPAAVRWRGIPFLGLDRLRRLHPSRILVRSLFRRTPGRAFVFAMSTNLAAGLALIGLLKAIGGDPSYFELRIPDLFIAALLVGTAQLYEGTQSLPRPSVQRSQIRAILLPVTGAFLILLWSFAWQTFLRQTGQSQGGEYVKILELPEDTLLGLAVPALIVRSVAFGLSALVLPASEEVFFRGYLIPALGQTRSPSHAALVSSLLFATWHVNYTGFLYYFVGGLILAEIWRRGGLKASIGAHALFNTCVYLLAVA